jgi:hypothetical protein
MEVDSDKYVASFRQIFARSDEGRDRWEIGILIKYYFSILVVVVFLLISIKSQWTRPMRKLARLGMGS